MINMVVKIDSAGNLRGGPIDITPPFQWGRIDNPSLAMMLAAGWSKYIPVEFDPETHKQSGHEQLADGSWTAVIVPLGDPELAVLLTETKEAQRQIVRAAFAAEEILPVMDNSGRWWNGGLQSSLRLDGGRRLAAETGQVSIEFTDIYDIGHDLTLAEAALVVYVVAGAFQVDFYHKQSLMRQIAAAETVAEVLAIV